MGNVHREWVLGKHDRVTPKLSGWLLLVQVPAGPLGSHPGHNGAMLGIRCNKIIITIGYWRWFS